MTTAARSPGHAQRGGLFVGLTVGLLLGLGLALAVALYVTKVPVPFINKVPQRTVEEASQAEKNRNWDPNAPLAGKTAASAPSGAAATNATTTAKATPAAPAAPPASAPSPAKAGASSPTGEAFTYFVQAGAYARPEDAEQQRANLALMGVTAKVTEREQAGRTVYRVRLGPFEQKDEAEAAKEKLAGLNVESALVRVQR